LLTYPGIINVWVIGVPYSGSDTSFVENGELAEAEDEDEDLALLPVKWGATQVDGPIGHCSFTLEASIPLRLEKDTSDDFHEDVMMVWN
jgi:hypothetical protein